MEFYEKLQQLRKQRGMTQEELAARLYVSRTAISKWESGRGYPNIESLREIAKFFSVTVDELLSSQEVLVLAEEDGKQRERRLLDLLYGFLDLSAAMLWFLPLFAAKAEWGIQSVSLLALDGASTWLQIAYWLLSLGMAAMGILTLALQAYTARPWIKSKVWISLGVNVVLLMLLILSRQPYAAVFVLGLLLIKGILQIKHP